jgi:hypothetical protein
MVTSVSIASDFRLVLRLGKHETGVAGGNGHAVVIGNHRVEPCAGDRDRRGCNGAALDTEGRSVRTTSLIFDKPLVKGASDLFWGTGRLGGRSGGGSDDHSRSVPHVWHRAAGGRAILGCGSLIALASEHAEYKQVTVLFADVVHSMDIAVAVGAERLREIMADLADRCAAVVQRCGGTLDKLTGDGFMALFGAPVAIEDRALRVCRG